MINSMYNKNGDDSNNNNDIINKVTKITDINNRYFSKFRQIQANSIYFEFNCQYINLVTIIEYKNTVL